MAILRMKEIRAMSSEKLNAKLSELRVELMKLKTMVKAGGRVENPGRIRAIKKTLARILTVMNEEKSVRHSAKRRRLKE
ncbi:MAG: 50S ribosomal protein L29 [Candidatus Bathyarchaeia archaeon]